MVKKTRYAFTLIELLVVIAVISILAAVLFPVFSSARHKAEEINDASNLKQLALAWHMYTQDYDDMCAPSGLINFFSDPPEFQQMWWGIVDKDGSPTVDPSTSLFWPYIKTATVDSDPSVANRPVSFGASDYGYNAWYLGGAGDFASDPAHACPVNLSKISDTVETVLFQDTADISSGAPERMAIAWPPSWTGNDQLAPTFEGRYMGFGNVAFVDGHVKAIHPHYLDYPSDLSPSPAQAQAMNVGVITSGNAFTDEYYNGTGAP